MREFAEFRVREEFASLLFADSEGVRLDDTVRKIVIESTDPRFARVGQLQDELRFSTGKPFFYGWHLQRRYTTREMAAASLLHVRWTRTFEPSGEECGTIYDESPACNMCGAGATQVGWLTLNGSRLPTGDFARTIGGEYVVSRRAKAIFDAEHVTGWRLDPVYLKGRGPAVRQSDWFQLVVVSDPAEIAPPTVAAGGPFNLDPENKTRCPLGHVIGLSLISEVWVHVPEVGAGDILHSRQLVGTRRGLLRPEPRLLVTPRVREMVTAHGLKGWQFEVAHTVPS
jgi:hypothetical protein